MSENNNKHIKTYATKDYVDGLVPRPIKLYVLDGSETFTIKPGNNLFDESAVVHVYENANIENLINMETLCGEFTFIYNGETKTVNLLLDGYSYLNPATSQYCFNFSSDFAIDDNHMGYAVFASEYDRMIDSGAEVSAQSAVTDYETIQENNLAFTIYDTNTYELAFAEITKVIIYANTYENTIKSDMIENVKWKQIMDQPYYIEQIANGGAYPLSICEFNQLMDGYDLEEVNHVLNASHPDYASHNGNITYNASMKCVTFPSVEGWKGLYFENIGQYETYKMGFLVFELTQYDGRCDIKIINEIVWDSGEVAVDETDFVKTENDHSTVEVSMFTDLVSGVSGKATRNLWLLVNTHGDSATIYNSRFVGQKMNSADLLLGWTNMKKYVNDTIAQASIGGEVDTSGFALKTDIPTKTSQLTNDSGFLTAHQDISGKADKTELHNHNNKTVLDTITNDMMTKWNKALPFEDSYVADCNTWLTNGYTKVSSSDTVNHPSQCTGADKWGILFFVAENATQGTGTQMYFPIDGTYKGRVFVRSMTNRSPGAWTLLSTFSGNYNDLTNKPTIPTIPTNISAFNNDSGYITSIPSEYVTETELNSKDYATKNYVDNQNNEIEKLLNDGKANAASSIQSMLLSKGIGGDNPYLIGNYIKSATYKNGTVGNTILRYINFGVNLSGINSGDYYKISFNNSSIPEKTEIIQCYDSTESGSYFINKTLNVSINETSSVIRVRLIKDKQVDANGSEIDAIGKCYIQLMLAGANATEENIAVFDETLFGLEFYTPNFLPRNNMLEYTPTEDYNPATKKYVDDNKFSGNYNDLTNKPNIPSVEGLATEADVNSRLDNKSFVFLTQAEYDALSDVEKNDENIVYQIIDGQISYNDLVDTPSLVNFATKDYVTDAINRASLEGGSGGSINLDAYALKSDLHSHNNKSVLDSITQDNITNWNSKTSFSGNYNDLTNKPTIPTKTSQLTNDSGFLKSIPSEYITETELNDKGYATTNQIPTKVSQLTNDNKYLSVIPSEYVTETDLNAKGYATTTQIPTKTSQLTNDSGYLTYIPSEYVTETELSNKGYLTQHQSLTDYAKKSDIPTKTSDLTNDSQYVTQDQLNTALGNLQIIKITKAEYNQLLTKDPNTLYLIVE